MLLLMYSYAIRWHARGFKDYYRLVALHSYVELLVYLNSLYTQFHLTVWRRDVRLVAIDKSILLVSQENE